MMKVNTLRRLSLCLLAAAGMTLPSAVARAGAEHPVYKITFVGRGESTTVDEVVVENLSNGHSVSLQGQDTLLLKAQGDLTAIGTIPSRQDGDLQVAGGTLTVSLERPAEVCLAVYTMDGRLAWQTRLQASARTASVALPPLGKGVYVVRATAPGLERSVKWATGGALSMTVGQDWQASQPSEPATATDLAQPLFAQEQEGGPRGVELEYAVGDVLRFTGTSGQMRTITMNTPRSSHPIYFDFFRCVDSDGYHYTIVRVGDQLWMAEDLHAQGHLDGVERVTRLEDWTVVGTGNPARMYVRGEGDVYYTRAAALKAMPEGWTLPTQGEADYLVGRLGGYALAGKAMKSRGTEWPSRETSVDAHSLGLTPHGDLYAQALNAPSQARYLLRSTRGLKPTSLVLQDGQDAVTVMSHADGSVGFHVRGMRSAPSAYAPMMQRFGLQPRDVPARVRGEANGPLGDIYTMKAGMQSVAFDFGGGQYKGADMERRSGILSCRDANGRDPKNFDFHHNAFARQDDRNTLRKMVAMTSPGGRQYVVEGKWSRSMRLWTQLIDGKYKRTDTPDVFGEGRVTLEFYGDSAQDYRQVRRVTLPDTYYYAPLSKSRLKYFLYDDENRTTESRIDYVQRHFQLLSADFNEDGVDDIVLSVNGDVYIYDGACLLDGREGQALMAHRNFRTANPDAPVRIALGDINSDGMQDVLVMRATGRCWVTAYRNGNLTDEMASVVVSDDAEKVWFIDLKVGRVTGGVYPEIVTLMRNFSGTTIAKSATMNIYRYRQGASGNIEAVPMTSNHVGSFDGYDGHIGNNNITLPYLRGQANPCDIIVGADLWTWDAAQGKVRFVEQVLGFVNDTHWSILADHIIAADVRGTGQDGLYYFASWNSFDRHASRYNLTCMCDAWFEPKGDFAKEHKYTVTRQTYYDDKYFHYGKNGTRWENSGQLTQVELMWWFGGGDAEWCNSAALCAVNDRTVGKRLKFKSRTAAWSEPRIYAMLAAPPTYTYGEGEQDPGYDFVTSWGYSRSSSTETTKSSSISSSAILGFELEINAPITGQKIAGMDFTTKIQQECTSSSSSASTVTYSQQYEARDDDRVVMQVTPYTVYTYEVVQADNPDEVGGDFIIAMPGQARTVGLGIQDYEYLMADAPGTPDISQVFTHTIGAPYSYPASGSDIRSVGQVMWGNGKEDDWVTTGSGGSVIREIALDKSSSQTAGFTFGVESELVVTTGCVKAGAGFGYNNTNETTHTEGEGFAVSACVPGLASGDRNPGRTFFDWNLCWYKYTLGGQTFPVVNYIVRPRSVSRGVR